MANKEMSAGDEINGLGQYDNDKDGTMMKPVSRDTDNGSSFLNGRYDQNDDGRKEEVDEEEEEEEEDEEVEGEEKDLESELLDGGYGWFVVLGTFLAHMILTGFQKSNGLILIHFQERFDAGALEAAWPGSIMSLLNYISAPLVSAVCNRYSARTSMMIGTALSVLGIILTSGAEEFYFLFFCYSFLQGLGNAFMNSPGLFLVSSYFEKRRGFAVSLAFSGGGVGTFLLVPLINYLFDFYGFQGSFLVFAAMMTHGFLVAMFFRPFRMHQKMSMVNRKVKENGTDLVKSKFEHEKEDSSSLVPLKQAPFMFKDSHSTHNPTQNVPVSTDNHDSCIQRHHQCKTPQITTSHAHTQAIRTGFQSRPHPQPPPCCSTNTCFLELKSCLKICFPTEHKRKLNDEKRKIFHFNLLKDVSFLLFLCATTLFTISMSANYVFIFPACVDKGLTKADAALVISITGIIDTITRIVSGFVLDLAGIKPFRTHVFTCCLFGMALMGLIPLVDSLATITIVSAMIGAFFGCHVSQRMVVLVDLMGKDVLPSCDGLVKMCQAFGMLTGPLIFGALRDSTGSYDIAFYVGGAIMVVSGIVMGLGNLVYRIQRRKEQARQLQTAS